MNISVGSGMTGSPSTVPRSYRCFTACGRRSASTPPRVLGAALLRAQDLEIKLVIH